MKKNFTFLSLALISFFVVANFSLAAEPLKYVPLVSLNPAGGAATEMTATGYIKTFLTAFMAVVVAMAIFMVVRGGIKLMFAGDQPSMKADGKKDIEGAIYGLVLALLTYTILFLVNPKLIPGENLFDFPSLSTTATK